MPLGPALTNTISSPQERVQSPVSPQPATTSRQHPVQPLLSPFVERKQSSFNPKPCVCSSTKRRRGTAAGSRSSRRCQHCARLNCPLKSFQSPAAFDRLPWISTLELPPDHHNLSDIADLSLIPVHVEDSPLGLGPIRRRRSSLRSNPFPSAAESSPQSSHSLSTPPFISQDLSSTRDPRTPPRDTIPQSQITFHNLMPCLDHSRRSS